LITDARYHKSLGTSMNRASLGSSHDPHKTRAESVRYILARPARWLPTRATTEPRHQHESSEPGLLRQPPQKRAL